MRTEETGKLLRCKCLSQNELLNEIDYGLAEGLTIAELRDKFPDLIESWGNNEDPRFPEGENQSDVQARLYTFLSNRFSKKILLSLHIMLF